MLDLATLLIGHLYLNDMKSLVAPSTNMYDKDMWFKQVDYMLVIW